MGTKEVCEFGTQIIVLTIRILKCLVADVIERYVLVEKLVPDLGRPHIDLLFTLRSHYGSRCRLIFCELRIHFLVYIILRNFLFLNNLWRLDNFLNYLLIAKFLLIFTFILCKFQELLQLRFLHLRERLDFV